MEHCCASIFLEQWYLNSWKLWRFHRNKNGIEILNFLKLGQVGTDNSLWVPKDAEIHFPGAFSVLNPTKWWIKNNRLFLFSRQNPGLPEWCAVNQPPRSRKVSVVGNLTCSYFTVSCWLPLMLQSTQETSVLPHGRHSEVCFLPLKEHSLVIALCCAWKGGTKESDYLAVIGRKKKKRRAPHFEMGGGRKMDGQRKMNLGREMSSFKMSDHAFPFILLTDFLRLALPKLRWQMKQPMHGFLDGGARRVQQEERLENRTLTSLQWLARRWSLTFTKKGSHQSLISSGSAVGANGRYEYVDQRYSIGYADPFGQGPALQWLYWVGRAKLRPWTWW